MIKTLMTAVFGTRFNRERKRIQPIVDQILSHDERLKDLSEADHREPELLPGDLAYDQMPVVHRIERPTEQADHPALRLRRARSGRLPLLQVSWDGNVGCSRRFPARPRGSRGSYRPAPA